MKKIQSKNRVVFHRLLLMIVFCSTLGACSTLAPKVESSDKAPPETLEKPDDCSFPAPKGMVSDYENLLGRAAVQSLEKKLSKLKANYKVELAVVIIGTTGQENIDDYSLRMSRCWGIGPKDTRRGGGVLLLIAKNDRRWRIQVSRNLEKNLPDSLVKEIGDQMAQEFKSGNYEKGIRQAVDDLITKLEKAGI